MVLTLSAVALPDAGTTGATLSAGMAHTLHEWDTAPRASTPVAAVGHQDAATLHKHREPVSLAAYDLGDPQAKVDVEREGDSNVARRQGGERVLSGLYEKIRKEKKVVKRKDIH